MILMYVLIVIFHVSSICAMEPSPESSQISRGSELQKRRAEDLSYEASSLSQIIKKNSAELNQNPEFKKVIGRTELNQDQLKRWEDRRNNKFRKLQREHQLHMQNYSCISTLFRKIMMAGFGMQAGCWLGAFPHTYEREWLGASLGITAVGALGYCYGKYQQRLMENCPPTRSDALNLVNKKDAQLINQ